MSANREQGNPHVQANHADDRPGIDERLTKSPALINPFYLALVIDVGGVQRFDLALCRGLNTESCTEKTHPYESDSRNNSSADEQADPFRSTSLKFLCNIHLLRIGAPRCWSQWVCNLTEIESFGEVQGDHLAGLLDNSRR